MLVWDGLTDGRTIKTRNSA